jgi:hypothetical protein
VRSKFGTPLGSQQDGALVNLRFLVVMAARAGSNLPTRFWRMRNWRQPRALRGWADVEGFATRPPAHVQIVRRSLGISGRALGFLLQVGVRRNREERP